MAAFGQAACGDAVAYVRLRDLRRRRNEAESLAVIESSLSDPLVGGSHRYALTSDNGLLFPIAVPPAHPLQTTGGFTGADYVMIAPTDFIPALGNLIMLRRSQGLTVAVENVSHL